MRRTRKNLRRIYAMAARRLPRLCLPRTLASRTAMALFEMPFRSCRRAPRLLVLATCDVPAAACRRLQRQRRADHPTTCSVASARRDGGPRRCRPACASMPTPGSMRRRGPRGSTSPAHPSAPRRSTTSSAGSSKLGDDWNGDINATWFTYAGATELNYLESIATATLRDRPGSCSAPRATCSPLAHWHLRTGRHAHSAARRAAP